jgi:hypothetical protein
MSQIDRNQLKARIESRLKLLGDNDYAPTPANSPVQENALKDYSSSLRNSPNSPNSPKNKNKNEIRLNEKKETRYMAKNNTSNYIKSEQLMPRKQQKFIGSSSNDGEATKNILISFILGSIITLLIQNILKFRYEIKNKEKL